MGVKNEFLEHYLLNKITPVKQNISDLDKHFFRRKSLYKTLGLTKSNFENKRILEVGFGGGYNPLVTNSFQPQEYVLVDANIHAIEDFKKIFAQHKIKMNNIKLHNKIIEDFEDSTKFDIAMCEGMIPGLSNKYSVLNNISSFVKKDGLLVLTCIDEVAIFFEILRYYIAQNLIINQEYTFDKEIEILVQAFGTHLDTLKGMSRFKEDWCADSLMGEAHFNYDFSFKECVTNFNEEYYYYNSSPNMFQEYRWYKETPTNTQEYNQYFLEQFDKKRHNLLLYNRIYKDREKNDNDELVLLCKKILSLVKDFKLNQQEVNHDIVYTLKLIQENIKNLTSEDNYLFSAIEEVSNLIQNREFEINTIANKYKIFTSAFGRGAFYISLLRR